MIQASIKIFILFAIVAISPSTGRLLAETPHKQPAMDQEVQNRLQLVGHENASRIQQVQCITGNACGKCDKCRSGSSKACGKCDKCRSNACDTCEKKGLFGWVKSVFNRDKCDQNGYGINNHCSNCRRLGRRCGHCRNGVGHPPFGVYQMVYPVNPAHCDPRDRNVHAAQGYGIPITVPLAPVVRHQYNYSWGSQGSRLTPISNYAPQPSNGYGYPSNYCPSCQPGSQR